MTAPHETDEFRNSCEWTVAITFRVAGGARWQTAHTRAREIAARLAGDAARLANVVEVSAIGGASTDGTTDFPERICFPLANTGRGTYGDPDTLDRYRDPDYQRGLDSLATANVGARLLSDLDQQRRHAVDCRNADHTGLRPAYMCSCVYCLPATPSRDGGSGGQCLCGQDTPGTRCDRHTGVQVVVLDGDPEPLRRHATPRDAPGRSRGLDGPELLPPPNY